MKGYSIGQRIVCVEGFDAIRRHNELCPVKGRTYTIRGFVEFHGDVGVLLEEIVNPVRRYKEGPNEAAFAIEHFRLAGYPPATSEILRRFKPMEERSDVQAAKEAAIKKKSNTNQ